MSDPVATAAPATTPAAAPAPAAIAPATAPAVAAPVAPGAAGLLTDPVAPAAPVQVTLPGKDAKPEEWAKYFDDIGAPKDASGYEVAVPEGQDGEFAKTATSWFAEARLTPAQANTLAAKWNEHMAGLTTAQKEAATKTASEATVAHEAAVQRDIATLKNEWGATSDKNMALAKQATREFITPFAGDKSTAVINAIEKEIGYAATIKFMHAIGARVGEPSPRGLGDTPVPKAPGLEDTMRASLNSALGRA